MSIKLDFSDCELKRIAKKIGLFLLTLALVVFGRMSSPAQPSLSLSIALFLLSRFSLFQEHNPQLSQKKLVSGSAIA
jgi:hypothetical protein